MSLGEERIVSILQQAKIKFKREYIFNDLKSLKQRPLRYDFALFDNNDKIFALIEYDGQAHFKYNKHFHKNYRDFKYRQELDLIKNEYALKNNIPLFRIPFPDLDKLLTYYDLFELKYKVKTKWHNHEVARKLQKFFL